MRSFIYFIAIMIGAIAGFWIQQPGDAQTENIPLMDAPDFVYETLDGTQHHLQEIKSTVTLIHFWASWCQPCKTEFPELIALAQHHSNLTILAISVDESTSAIRKFLKGKALPANLQVIQDKDKAISRDRFQTVNYPETILVGCNGKMEDKIIGPAQDWEATVKPLLAACNAHPSSL